MSEILYSLPKPVEGVDVISGKTFFSIIAPDEMSETNRKDQF